MFVTTELAQSWETWHKHYGHVSYDGLQNRLSTVRYTNLMNLGLHLHCTQVRVQVCSGGAPGGIEVQLSVETACTDTIHR
jgi:hypothetical protein